MFLVRLSCFSTSGDNNKAGWLSTVSMPSLSHLKTGQMCNDHPQQGIA